MKPLDLWELPYYAHLYFACVKLDIDLGVAIIVWDAWGAPRASMSSIFAQSADLVVRIVYQ